MINLSGRAPLTALVYPDKLFIPWAFRRLKPAIGDPKALERVVVDPQAAVFNIVRAMAIFALHLWPGWYGIPDLPKEEPPSPLSQEPDSQEPDSREEDTREEDSKEAISQEAGSKIPYSQAQDSSRSRGPRLSPSPREDSERWPFAFDAPAGLDRLWLDKASAKVSKGSWPFFPHSDMEIQARQLALALAGQIGSIHLAAGGLESLKGPEDLSGWLSVGKRLESLGGVTGIPIVFLLPERLYSADYFSGFPGPVARWEDQGQASQLPEPAEASPGTWAASPEDSQAQMATGERPKSSERAEKSPSASRTAASESEPEAKEGEASLDLEGSAPRAAEARLPEEPARPLSSCFDLEESAEPSQEGEVFVKEGQPHPFSPPEQILTEALSRDEELTGLFKCNQPLKALDKKIYADFFWEEGALVVEVDGYAFHKTQERFAWDRHRDWLLLVSGRRIFRLTALEVMTETEEALNKIRKAVRFVREGASGEKAR